MVTNKTINRILSRIESRHDEGYEIQLLELANRVFIRKNNEKPFDFIGSAMIFLACRQEEFVFEPEPVSLAQAFKSLDNYMRQLCCKKHVALVAELQELFNEWARELARDTQEYKDAEWE